MLSLVAAVAATALRSGISPESLQRGAELGESPHDGCDVPLPKVLVLRVGGRCQPFLNREAVMSRSERKKRIREIAAKLGKSHRGAANVIAKNTGPGTPAAERPIYIFEHLSDALSELFARRPAGATYTAQPFNRRHIDTRIGPNGEVAMVPTIDMVFLRDGDQWTFNGEFAFIKGELWEGDSRIGADLLHAKDGHGRFVRSVRVTMKPWLASCVRELMVESAYERGDNVVARLALRLGENALMERDRALREIHGTNVENYRPRTARVHPNLGPRESVTQWLTQGVAFAGTTFEDTTWRLTNEAQTSPIRLGLKEPITSKLVEDIFHLEVCPLRIQTSTDGGRRWHEHPNREAEWDWIETVRRAADLPAGRVLSRIVTRMGVTLIEYSFVSSLLSELRVSAVSDVSIGRLPLGAGSATLSVALRNADDAASQGERYYARSPSVDRVISASEFHALSMAGARYERTPATPLHEPQP